MYAHYVHTLYYIHTVDTYMTAVCINVYMIMLNMHTMALVCVWMGMQELQLWLWIAITLRHERVLTFLSKKKLIICTGKKVIFKTYFHSAGLSAKPK